jgi:GT2 family glycosyltransferase
MSETATIRHLDLRRGEPPAPDAELAYDIFWWGDLPVGAKASARGELPLGAGQLRSLAAHFLARQLAGRDFGLGAPLVAGSEGRPHAALRLEDAATLDRLEERLAALTALPPRDASDVALIICTRDRPRALQRCLSSLRHQLSQPGQLIVVDNSARGSAKKICSELSGIDYVHEPTPGLSRARNAGIRAARRSILAFTDDDVEPHPAWLSEVSRAFREHDVECVTGLVLPATLGTEAQRSFQFAMGAFGSNFVPLLFDGRFFAETRPHGAHVWRIGAGANMAFRRAAFERAGLFDERLGAGASGCSEDSEFWYRLLALGGSCLYEPRAVVLHHHRSEWRELRSQVRVYMRGHVSALVAQYDAFGDRGNLRRIGLQLPHHFARVGIGALVHGRWDRLKLLAAEIGGWFAGLAYLVRPGWRRRRGTWQKL